MSRTYRAVTLEEIPIHTVGPQPLHRRAGQLSDKGKARIARRLDDIAEIRQQGRVFNPRSTWRRKAGRR